MNPLRIEGATRTLGAPTAWVEDELGKCVGLPIKDCEYGGYPWMISCWEFTPQELKDIIQNGGKLYLWLAGTQHPPVALTTNKPEFVPEG